MGAPFARPSFSAGEIDPNTHGRVDVDKFHVGLARCENWRVKRTGSLENRTGHRYLGRLKYGDRTTIFWKLKRDADNNYSIEVGHRYFRFWKGRVPIMQGTDTASADMLHLLGSAWVWYESATPGLWYLLSGTGGPPEIFGAPAVVKRYVPDVADITVPAQDIDSIADGWAWGDLDGLGFSTLYVGSSSSDLNNETTTGYRLAIPGQLEIESPYEGDDVPFLKKEISGDVIFITRRGYPPAKLSRLGDFEWVYEAIDFNGQTGAVDSYGFTPSYPLPSPPSGPDWTIQYQVTRLGVDGNESQGRSIYIASDDLPDSATPPPIGTLGPVWTIESTEQGDARNIIIDPNEYEWIDAYVYSASDTWRYEDPIGPADEIQIWFLARKGTGLDGPGAGGTNLAEDPEIFDDVDQIGPVMLWDITDPDAPGAVTRGKKDGEAIATSKHGYEDRGEWAWGISSEIRAGIAFVDTGIINFATLWIMSGAWTGLGPMVPPASRKFEMTLETDAGYNLFRRYAKVAGIDGRVQGGTWFPWGRLAAVDAYGGTLLSVPNRSPYDDPMEQLPKIVGAYRDNGQVIPDDTLEPPAILLDFNAFDRYPEAVGFLGQRLVLAGSNEKPNRLRASATGEFYNFSTPSTVKDSSPIDRSLTTPNRIKFIVEVGNGSGIIFTAGSEWRIWGEGGVISPLSINTVEISQYGCLEVQPLKVGSRVVYLTELGKTVNAIAFDLAQDNFASRDISSMSGHMLFEFEVVAMDYAATPDKTIYMVRADGQAIGITFDEDQQMNAWHRHFTQRGEYRWVHTSRNGRFDDVYFVVRRTINGQTVQYLEVLDQRDWTRQEQACFLDCSVSLDQPRIAVSDLDLDGDDVVVSCAEASLFDVGDEVMLADVEGEAATTLDGRRARIGAIAGDVLTLVRTDTGEPIELGDLELPVEGPFSLRKVVTTLWGLDHLEGESVAVLGDGRDLGDFTVEGGKVELGYGVADAVVGIPIEGAVDSLPFTGAAGSDTLNDTKRNVGAFHVKFRQSAGVEIGLVEDELVEWKPEDVENPNLPAPLLDGTHTVIPLGNWGDGQIFIRSRRPFPAHILSITPEYDVARS